MNGTSPCCKSTQTWLPSESFLRPPWMNHLHVGQYDDDNESGDPRGGTQISEQHLSCPYMDVFCSSQASIPMMPLAPLAGTFMPPSWPQSDVVKQGYLGKLERSHRRYFVLRAGSHMGPSCLEWYKSREKFTVMRKLSGKGAAFGSSKHGTISSSRKGHTVALYAKDQTMVLVVEDQQEQDEWCFAIKKLIEEERRDEERGEEFDEEDDGYCTLPPAASFKQVWPVLVKPRGLGRSKSFSGEMRLCLTASSLILVKVGAGSDPPSVTIPLLSVRRFGHLEGLFFLELGRSVPEGPGEIWMGAGDQGNSGIAQHIHEVVRETVHALRALPEFSLSPSSNSSQPQNLHSKRNRYKFRDKTLPVKPLTLPPARNSNTQSPSQPCTPTATESEGTLRFMSHLSPGSGSVEMKTQDEEQEEELEGQAYMMMSPQASRSSSMSVPDEYMTMTSPQKHNQSLHSPLSHGLHASFHCETSDKHSPLRPSCLQMTEYAQKKEDSIRTSIDSCRPQDRRYPAQPRAVYSTSSLGSVTVANLMTKPTHVSPNSRRSGRHQAAQEQVSVGRRCRSSCLMSCLQSEDTS